MVQFYRGEISRANHWRQRLDITSNWAVITSMGMLSFAFSGSNTHHASIVLGMMILFHFMLLEARRYLFFDVWRNRVRMIEENFFGPILTRELHSPAHNWATLVAGDLLRPRFKITLARAMKARLKRNYGTLFIIMMFSWLLKLGKQMDSHSIWESASVGVVSGYWIVGLVAVLYLFLIGLVLFVPAVPPPELEYWSNNEAPRM